MKITSVWRGNKPNHKKKRTVPKLRIRWTQLGLVDPSVDSPETPMDEIRRAVTNLASSGFRLRFFGVGGAGGGGGGKGV